MSPWDCVARGVSEAVRDEAARRRQFLRGYSDSRL